ncbi:transposase is116 is110 is902 family protein [Leptolyngbya sp. Heron Island J]|uniref:IS110 family transposase n=1 Tax=Leptolyngbya sp. Heron Island J TaxID=1385935 RepID=UPI0003B94206|nr:IS110 family transposase [Leptolyngbya sp. Heron Island J]ESA33602.1 transposase is116 is110 is902 family protein [Leptolyngbya sp. Heron Island J]ESA33925.1 transposase is116 is110 is902 family protein [Leptolyngbya sp. Heron Island J]ESA37103.1 transposase is116 is110 is902 family protein [Leptolyngbya sp. Heron Island J]ESA37169.1 transposase is116 is110 is902 family protein [Leptolyngbya sp. Heron Island J]ESA37231.1 transposase is116 is110 is902 family protein [Leptolyngbya sp. Heron I
MSLPCLGIDVGKHKLYAALLLRADKKPKRKTVSNDASGHQALVNWLAYHQVERVHACVEATSTYAHPVARTLHEQGHVVTIANPKQIKAYGESLLVRTKTDRVDASLIAQFCFERKPRAWTPPAPEVDALQALVRRLDVLEKIMSQERNRLETTPEELVEAIKRHLEFLKGEYKLLLEEIKHHIDRHDHLKKQRDLITSIPGIGDKTAAIILAEVGDIRFFKSARQLAAHAGLTPKNHDSGSSIHKKPRLSKMGNARLRKALYMPALASINHNLVIAQFRDRLLAAGKLKMQVVGAIMHKLIRWVFGVLHSGHPFDANKALAAQA